MTIKDKDGKKLLIPDEGKIIRDIRTRITYKQVVCEEKMVKFFEEIDK